MGLVADNLNYRDGHTVYNDWKMDGLKYSNVGAVSYTHLDVYKRQQYDRYRHSR